ncbi:MAG: serine hydrolase domain-containing protein [Hydrogeniiclostridium sp.]
MGGTLPVRDSTEDIRLHELCREIFEWGRERNFNGVMLVKRGGAEVFSEACGFAHRGFRIPNRMDIRFDTASITKVFTAAAVLQAVENGLFGLRDRITDLVDLCGTAIPADVEIFHLLTHTSGIADDADEEAGESYSDLFRESPNYAIRECRNFLKNFAYKEPLFPAGTNVRYNNCAFVLLGLAIENTSGIPYRRYAEEHVFRPAGMLNTEFCSMDGIHENVAEGYTTVFHRDANGNEKAVGYKKNIYSYPPIGTPDGGAYTTAEDLNRFLSAVREGRLFSQKTVEQFLQPQIPISRPYSHTDVPGALWKTGYAFEFLQVDGETFVMYKDGINDGVAGIFAFYPFADMTLTILANQDCNVWEMQRKFQSYLFERFWKQEREEP